MKRALVTGGAGFIGSWIVDYLIEEGYKVVIIDNLSSGKIDNLNKRAKFYKGDIGSEEIREIFEKEKPDYVFHLAAEISVIKSIKDPLSNAKTNILATLNLLNCCVEYNVKKFIFSSTGGAIYGDGCKIPTPETEKEEPASPYGISKLSIEKYLQFYKNVHGLDFVSLRYSNVYGPRQDSKGEAGVVAIFIGKILSKEILTINGSGNQTRDYVYVEDIAKANLLALNLSGIYNVSSGKETSVNEIFREIVEEMKVDIKEIHGPEIKGEQMRSCLSSEKLLNEGWKVKHDLDLGIKKTIEYFKDGR